MREIVLRIVFNIGSDSCRNDGKHIAFFCEITNLRTEYNILQYQLANEDIIQSISVIKEIILGIEFT